MEKEMKEEWVGMYAVLDLTEDSAMKKLDVPNHIT